MLTLMIGTYNRHYPMYYLFDLIMYILMYYLFINLQIKREFIYLAHPFMQPLANSDSVALFTPLLPLLQS